VPAQDDRAATGTPEDQHTEPARPAAPPPPLAKRERKYLIPLSMLVLLPGLGISAWSFYGYAREALAPMLLAASASAAIDGIGLFAAYFAARFTNRGQSARFPRLVTYLMIAASVYVNWEHASSQHWSTGLHVLVSAPAVASAFAFEILMLELRVNERAKREQRRRSRMSAKVDADLWLHHPFAVWGARRWESRDRLAELFPGHKTRPARDADPADTANPASAVAAPPVAAQVHTHTPDPAVAPQPAPVETPPPTPAEVHDDVDITPGTRVDTDTARAYITTGWLNGEPAAVTAAKSGRSTSLVYREFKTLTERHGPRPGPDDTGEVPSVDAVNGTAQH
jgi:hypothetical protein